MYRLEDSYLTSLSLEMYRLFTGPLRGPDSMYVVRSPGCRDSTSGLFVQTPGTD